MCHLVGDCFTLCLCAVCPSFCFSYDSACVKDLKDFMRSAGDITYADAHKQKVGEGYVSYTDVHVC